MGIPPKVLTAEPTLGRTSDSAAAGQADRTAPETPRHVGPYTRRVAQIGDAGTRGMCPV
jgi:hypothetical protein